MRRQTRRHDYAPLKQEYARLAPVYDRRWQGYVRASVDRAAARLALQPDETLVDVGCGTGALLAMLSQQVPTARLTGIDLSSEMLAVAREHVGDDVSLIAATAERLPLPDASQDAVVSTSAFHYVRHPLPALGEMRRVLKPGGRVVIVDWCDDFLTCRLCDLFLRWFDDGHYRIYRSDECRELLIEAGFANVNADRYKISWLWGLMTVSGHLPNAEEQTDVERVQPGFHHDTCHG
ncbi:class I SAM-dependent methyltransferase [Aidingimonas halophila]|uniref:Methyltransferase domain-containing protein n=1 Tax=Aidingimonas halophila TaxID=574349 RepID=A0A1H3A5L9_9GAMM|nr:methyltransferase domain-containing protein [Aidingimonas halophila]GHC21618.1 SAM-dependent methyltransferase [Aidingimonas halophila]SDX24926.1 Methyltransferase domain-containing protein [Aidingimonas halophila]